MPDVSPPTLEPDGPVVCATCGKVRPSSAVCGCGQPAGPTVPDGWTPELTRTGRPRLPLTGPAPRTPDQTDPGADPGQAPDGRPSGAARPDPGDG